jgi:hypothetical protein
MAERVIRRALLLEHDVAAPETGLAVAALKEVADDLGLGIDEVRRVLLEELELGDRPRLRVTDRLVGPSMVRSRRVAHGSPEAVERALFGWMLQHEGLQARRRDAGQTLWEGGDRQSRLSRGVLRTLPRVISRTRTVADDRELVEIEGDLSHLRRGRMGLAMVAVGFGAFVGVMIAALTTWVGDGAEFLAAFLPVAGLGLGLIAGGSGREAARIEDAVARAVDAACHPELTELNRRIEVEESSRSADDEGRRPETWAASRRSRNHRGRSRPVAMAERRDEERGDDRRRSRSYGERVSGLLEELVEDSLG